MGVGGSLKVVAWEGNRGGDRAGGQFQGYGMRRRKNNWQGERGDRGVRRKHRHEDTGPWPLVSERTQGWKTLEEGPHPSHQCRMRLADAGWTWSRRKNVGSEHDPNPVNKSLLWG